MDKDGKSVAFDFPDQADMCELVRALIADEKIQTQGNVMNMNEDFIENIDCPGNKEKGQSEICAVSGQSAGMQYAWTIFLDPQSMEVSGKPEFVKA